MEIELKLTHRKIRTRMVGLPNPLMELHQNVCKGVLYVRSTCTNLHYLKRNILTPERSEI